MKVLQINAINKLASTGRTTFEMNEFLNKNGYDCVTAYSKGVSVNDKKEYIIGSNQDTKIHGLLSRISGKQGYFSYSSTKKLLKFMDEYRPEVVLLRNLHGNFINLPMLLKYLAKKDIATVAVLHDCWFYTGKCCHYTVQGCYKWKEYCGNCPQLKKYNKSWFFDRTGKMLRDKKKLFGAIPRLAVIGVSDWLTEEAKKAPVFANAKVFKRIYNWIGTETFKPVDATELREKLGLKGKKVLLAVASGWNKEKGIDTVLEISKRLSKNEKLVLVGNVSGVDLNENILHIPATNSVEELADYYSLADVFIQPSLEETFGKVSAEALSCGTPVVCFNSTANPELVGNGCGAAVSPGDIEAMFEEIKTILKNGKGEYVDKCRNFAEENFNMKKNLNQYLKLFNRLVAFEKEGE